MENHMENELSKLPLPLLDGQHKHYLIPPILNGANCKIYSTQTIIYKFYAFARFRIYDPMNGHIKICQFINSIRPEYNF